MLEVYREAQEQDKAARWEMRERFDTLVPQHSQEDGKLSQYTRERALALCAVQKCFGRRLWNNMEDSMPICLLKDPIFEKQLLPV